jgi:Zn-dependent peptidase ImmA (M78 family)
LHNERKDVQLNIRVNPKLLQWARREAGYSIDEIAARLNVDLERYRVWEETGIDIPWSKLKEISKHFKRQIAVFFLPEFPPDTKRPSDFRNRTLAGSELSKKALLAIRRAQKCLTISSQLFGQEYWFKRYQWMSEVTEPNQLRAKLQISIGDQQAFKFHSEAFKAWRNAIESQLGIFVFQFSMPFEELQAFCLSETPPFAIVVNSKHTYTGRIFSLFHETAHILMKQSGICYPDSLDDNQTVEFVCNDFAGRILIPDAEVPTVSSLDDLTLYANKFKVSQEVVLRRNLERGYVSREDFFSLLAEIRRLPIPKGGGGPSTPVEKAQASRGQMFFNIVVQALQNNRLDFNTASDALGLKLNYLMYVYA